MVITAAFTVSANAAPVAYDQTWGDTVEGNIAANTNNLNNLHQEVQQLNAGASVVSTLQTQVTQIQQSQGDFVTKPDFDTFKTDTATTLWSLDSKADKAQDSADQNKKDLDTFKNDTATSLHHVESEAQQAQDTADKNTGDIQNHESRITLLENAPKPTNGVDGKNGKDGATGAQGAKGDTGAQGVQGIAGANGKDGINGKDGKNGVNGKDGVNGRNGANGRDGKNGVTSTITKVQVDKATQAQVARNTVQSAQVAKDLKDAKSFISQAQTSNNNQFKSLKDEIDGNKKEARSGAASAVAIASMPQVEAGQTMMFSAGVGSFKSESAVSVGASFHAGSNTIIKAGVSTTTNNDFAMGAGIGFGF